MSLTETFSNSIDLVVINESGKGTVIQIEQCLGTFTMLLVEGPSENWLFRHLPDYVFGVCNLGNTKAKRVIIYSKYIRLNLDLKDTAKKWEKVFWFGDNCIWICIVNLSLLRTGYFPSEANLLTRSLKIFHVNKRDFFQVNWLGRHQWLSLRWCDADFDSA